MTTSQRPQFTLRSILIAVTCIAAICAYFKAWPRLATITLAPMTWLVAGVWSLRRTYRAAAARSSWSAIRWPYWILLATFVATALAIATLIVQLARYL